MPAKWPVPVSIVYCNRAPYHVRGNPGEIVDLLEGTHTPPTEIRRTFYFLDLAKGGQVAVNPKHVSSVEMYRGPEIPEPVAPG